MSIIFITHDLGVIAQIADYVVVMYLGRIVELTTDRELYRNPLHPYSQALIGAYPSLKGEKKKLSSIHGAPPRLIDPPQGCRFEPRCSHAMALCAETEPAIKEKDGRRVACHLIK